MAFSSFEEIHVWKKSQDLAVEIYQHFGNKGDWGFRDQITKAAVSISNNIAEGYERNGDKEFVRFLTISKGSAAEVKSMLYLAERLEKISMTDADKLRKDCDSIQRMLFKLIAYLSSS